MYMMLTKILKRWIYLKLVLYISLLGDLELRVQNCALDVSVSLFVTAFVSWKNMLSIRFIISEFPTYPPDCSDFHSSIDSSIRAFDKNLLPETDAQLFLFWVSHQRWLTLIWNSLSYYLFIYGVNYFMVLSMSESKNNFRVFFFVCVKDNYDEEIEVYKHHLEQTYKLCRPCQTAVEYYIKHQNRQLRALLLNHQLRRSRDADKAFVTVSAVLSVQHVWRSV